MAFDTADESRPMSKRVSVVIPTHNRAKLLKELLLALQHQTLDRDQFEVIVVADGMDDPAWPMLQALEVPYQLRPVRQRQSGPSVTRNHGARLAEGEVLVFVDDDMLPGERFLEEHLRLHGTNGNAVVIGPYLPVSRGLVEGQGGWNVWEARVLDRHYEEVANGKRPPAGRRLYSGNFSVRRDDFWRVGGFDKGLERGEDIELGFRLQRAGLKYQYGAEAGALHRGFRGFESWCRSAYLYGRCDAMFARQKQEYQVMPEVMEWYRRQKRAVRLAVGLCVGRSRVYSIAIGLLRFGSDGLTKARLHGLAHYGYSGIYKLQYWRGFIDELGGKAAFERQVALWRARRREERPSDHKSARPA